MKVAREETFGPLAPLFRFEHAMKKALQMANDTEFGLASYFFSRDIGRCLASRGSAWNAAWSASIRD